MYFPPLQLLNLSIGLATRTGKLPKGLLDPLSNPDIWASPPIVITKIPYLCSFSKASDILFCSF